MIFGFNKKKSQDVIQKELQMEDDAFHRNIVALERLEAFLINADNRQVGSLPQTAVGTERDHHVDNIADTAEMCYLELQLACKGLYMCAGYKDPEIFKIAVEAFMKDLLEWYGGRCLLDYYDSVEAAVIPMMTALSQTSKDIDGLFETYVYKASELSEASTEEKYDATRSGVNAWLKAWHILEHETKAHKVSSESEYITSHFRGSAIDGYKRIVAALSNLFNESAPLKIFVKMVNQYLPEIAAQLPSISEESIDRMYAQKYEETPSKEETPIESDLDIEIDLYGLEDADFAQKEKGAKNLNVHNAAEKETKPSRDETYARILKLADEIISLVKSLKEEK